MIEDKNVPMRRIVKCIIAGEIAGIEDNERGVALAADSFTSTQEKRR